MALRHACPSLAAARSFGLAALALTLVTVSPGCPSDTVEGAPDPDVTAPSDVWDAEGDGAVTPDAAPDVEPDTGPDVEPDTAPDVEPDTAPDVEPDTSPDSDATEGCDSDADCAGALEGLGPCEVPTCDLASNTCAAAPAPDGTGCDDADACTEGDTCQGGLCAPGAATDCDDGDICTLDSCDAVTGCSYVNDPACGGGDCGDGVCDGEALETCESCPADCGACTGSSCCEPSMGTGCDDPECEAIVCGVDAFCCEAQWDETCVLTALELCTTCGGACGDGTCDPGLGESCATCASDCGACPGGGDCCQPGLGPACEDDACNAAVCFEDTYCCDTEWDGSCADLAATLCDVCGGDADSCCAANVTAGCSDGACEAEVCELDVFCCTDGWDEVCAEWASELCEGCGGASAGCGDGLCDPLAFEDCLSCPEDCGACGGDCCAATGEPGCGDGECEAAVCAEDAFCCSEAWDDTCAAAASALCAICEGGGEPVCGDAVCAGAPFENCASCPADCGACPGESTCCQGDEGPGCDDPACEEVVCGEDPFCCELEWDFVCQSYALELCPGICVDIGDPVCGDDVCDVPGGEGCASCAADCGPCVPTTCCDAAAEGVPGCDDPVCEAAVCEVDPFCCEAEWDLNCATAAASLCAACEGQLPGCGDGVCDPSGGEDCLGCPGDCGECPVGSECCSGKSTPGCDADPSCELLVCEEDDFCCVSAWDEACALIAAGACGVCGADGPECGDALCEAPEDCALCPADCGDCGGFSGDCCAANGSVGCEDADCASAVCAEDAFCCDDSWDTLCAELAGALCPGLCGAGACGDGTCDQAAGESCEACPEDCGGCPDCCTFWGGKGCGGGEIETCVCGFDTYCCETIWDSNCATQAILDCGLECTDSPACGDGVCDAATFESCASCPADCGTCPGDGGGDCCFEQEGPGCDDPTLEACVCEVDDFCCAFIWDSVCVELAVDECSAECAGGSCGDGFCEELSGEDCESCAEDCGVCTGGPCCEANGTPGCESPSVEACVCAADLTCCNVQWDGFCAAAAALECGACPGECGDGQCTGEEDCTSCAEDCGACPECGDGVCQLAEDCVTCVEDCGACPECGDGSCDIPGGEDCATCAADCGECAVCGDGACSGAETCVSCAEDCGECSSVGCCSDAEQGPAGCESEPACEAAVCEVDPFCCEAGWDEVCTECALGASTTPGCSAASALCCLEFVCGDGVCAEGETCEGCAADCGVCPDSACCAASPTGGCGDDAIELCVCAAAPSCCDTAWDETCVDAAAGCGLDCTPILEPAFCGDGACNGGEACGGCPADCGTCPAVCGDGTCDLDGGESCTSCDTDCGSCDTSTCCVEQPDGTTGCDTPSVESCVCGIDTFCCVTQWDGLCAGYAVDTCGSDCIAPGGEYCGNAVCDLGESCDSCPSECCP